MFLGFLGLRGQGLGFRVVPNLNPRCRTIIYLQEWPVILRRSLIEILLGQCFFRVFSVLIFLFYLSRVFQVFKVFKVFKVFNVACEFCWVLDVLGIKILFA